jgi:hypothetical protein
LFLKGELFVMAPRRIIEMNNKPVFKSRLFRHSYKALSCLLLLGVIIIVPLFASCGCEQNYMYQAGIKFDTQPHGGTNVQTLSCSITAMTIWMDTGDDVDSARGPYKQDYTVQWMTVNGSHKKETFTSNKNDSFTTTFSAPQGKFLDKTFWVEVSWQDSYGKHSQNSEQAVCTVR